MVDIAPTAMGLFSSATAATAAAASSSSAIRLPLVDAVPAAVVVVVVVATVVAIVVLVDPADVVARGGTRGVEQLQHQGAAGDDASPAGEEAPSNHGLEDARLAARLAPDDDDLGQVEVGVLPERAEDVLQLGGYGNQLFHFLYRYWYVFIF